MNAPEQQGARYVLQANKDWVLEMETPDDTVLIGIDTPEDYRLYFGTDP